jgi:hypothetical protein
MNKKRTSKPKPKSSANGGLDPQRKAHLKELIGRRTMLVEFSALVSQLATIADGIDELAATFDPASLPAEFYRRKGEASGLRFASQKLQRLAITHQSRTAHELAQLEETPTP